MATIANRVVSYVSSSGSRYYFSEEGVYRVSNHWGRAANCRWRLQASTTYQNQHTKIGYARWIDFYCNDEHSKLYYITVDFGTKTITYHHKDAEGFRGSAALITAGATAKRIALIKLVLTTSDWAKHIMYSSLEELRRSVVYDLITTETSFIQIKQKHL